MKTEIAAASLTDSGYIVVEYLQEDITLTKNEVEYGWMQALSIDPSKTSGICILTAKWSLLTHEARDYVMKEMRTWPQVAIVVHDLAQKLIGNFALKVSGKSKQIRIFECKEEAESWLSAGLGV